MKKRAILMSALMTTGLLFNACNEESMTQKKTDSPKTSLTVTGGELEMLEGTEAGLSLDEFPQVKKISFSNWKNMTDIPETGVFLIEGNHIPYTFKEDLKAEGLTLNNDGTLVNAEGQKTTLFIHAQSFTVIAKDKGELARTNGNPFPFTSYSWNMYWKYNGGYCRDYQAWTKAYSWGPVQGGLKLPTSIEYIYTYASIGSRTDSDYCYNCQNEESYVKWDIGCFWPAHGTASGYHYAYWKDGSITANHSWSW